MSIISLFALACAMLIFAVTSGPGIFVTISCAFASGFRRSMVVVVGIVLGDLIFLLFAIYGLAAIAKHSQTLFLVIKYVGAAYLIGLGIKLWREKPKKMGSPGWVRTFLESHILTWAVHFA